MKKTLSLILAALLLASSLASCVGTDLKETEAETKVPETGAVETHSPETNANVSVEPGTTYTYPTDLVTENEEARAHIVLSASATDLEKHAAEELRYHIKKVSGADIEITDAINGYGVSIIIGTPDSVPELETLFAEDIAWLTTLEEEDGRRWGDDGFAIRQLTGGDLEGSAANGNLYIFGATPRGALNGVYEFIEENMGVLWIRSNEENGLIYDEMPTITVAKANYREKSPFALRGWTLAYEGVYAYDTEFMLSRNKMNASMTRTTNGLDVWLNQNAIGIEPFISNHNLKWWLTNSPIYDPNAQEYWGFDAEGNPLTSAAPHVNYWSELAIDTIAAHVIAFLDQYKDQADLDYIGICLEDGGTPPAIYPDYTLPFEYAPGQFVNPSDKDYSSTVVYTFLNKIAQQVGEKYPDIVIHTYAYFITEIPPRCEIEDNLYITFCTYFEDLCFPLDEPKNPLAEDTWNNLQGWADKTKNMIFYNYYGCFSLSPVFERPIWKRLQADMRYYAENGFIGTVPEGVSDNADMHFRMSETPDGDYNCGDVWGMNALTFWLYSKLTWNPEEDVDALIDLFCERVYGDAAENMREYYRILELGWVDGAATYGEEFNALMKFYAEPWEYYYNFLDIEVDGIHILDSIKDALAKAWEAADDRAKEHIRRPYEMFNIWESFLE